MFRWKKRDEGFEWHQYVRTTIKLRRDARREKAQKLGEQVAGGARAAGAAADEMAKNSARRLGDAARVGVGRIGQGAAAAMGLAGLGLGSMAGLGRRVLPPVVDLLGRPGVGGPLTFIGVIALAAGLLRAFMGMRGLDFEAIAAISVGVLCLALGIGPGLWLGHGAWPKRIAAPITGLPSMPWRIAAGAAVVLLVAGIGLRALPGGSGASFPQIASLQSFSLTGGETISGRASAVAADTLRVGDRKVRLKDIEAPDANQRCPRGSGRGSHRTWACGQEARETLQRLVQGKTVTCQVHASGGTNVVLGRCDAKGQDVGEALVRAGFVFAERGLMPAYGTAEAAAKGAKAGLWGASEPERPAQWRDRLWAAAKRDAPDGCPIKGRVRGRERVYLLPWASNYHRVRISTRRGERWFCSQDEAEAAGWRNAQSG
jgi:endonuclease YncB( thermonuclease family)